MTTSIDIRIITKDNAIYSNTEYVLDNINEDSRDAYKNEFAVLLDEHKFIHMDDDRGFTVLLPVDNIKILTMKFNESEYDNDVANGVK